MDKKVAVLPTDQKKKSQFRQYLAAVVVNMTSFVYGVAIGWPSPAIPLLQAADTPVGSEPMTVSSASWLGSLMSAGALAATPVYSCVCERRSRKMVGYVVGLCGAVGWLLVVVAPSEAVLLSARVVLGFAASGSNILCAVYVPEIVDDDIRGSLGALINMFMCGGVLFAYVFGSYTPFLVFNVLCFVIPVAFLVVFWWMPESPAYLDSVGKHAEARRTRGWLRLKEQAAVQRDDRVDINAHVPQAKRLFVKEAFTDRGTRNATLIGLGLVANNQLSGIIAVLTYTVTIFQESGSALPPNLSTIIVGAIMVLAVYVASVLMDRAGRRVLLLGSNISLAVSLTILGVFFNLKNRGDDMSSVGWVPVTCLCAYVAGNAVGSGTVPFVIIGEIFPPDLKNAAVSFCICVLNLLCFLVARFFLSVVEALGMDGCYWLFASFCLALAAFAYFCVPETKNRSLDSILKELSGEDVSDSVAEGIRLA